MEPYPRDRKLSPTAADATSIVELVHGHRVARVTRFQTGTAHYVFDVAFADGTPPLVVRLTRSDLADSFRGAVSWYPLLQAQGVPLPELLYAELDATVHGFPVMLLERLPGKDLGDVYTSLTQPQRAALARDIAAFQRRVQAMPPGSGFGYATSYEDSSLHVHWLDVVTAHLERSRSRITDHSIVDAAFIEKVAGKLDGYRSYFDTVSPTPFLDDTTTKNVLIHRGKLTGVVDVDFVCFGDITQLLGLIRMAVLSLGGATDYVDVLADELALNQEQRKAIGLYTVLYGVDFLTAAGHRFNKDEPTPVDSAHGERLKNLVAELLLTV